MKTNRMWELVLVISSDLRHFKARHPKAFMPIDLFVHQATNQNQNTRPYLPSILRTIAVSILP